ncbi:MAG TPA: PhzF family phenazine biosynthesis protein [Steroidobacteraceae bacterium]|jgi:PhzF family phenazine biosynthesis protein
MKLPLYWIDAFSRRTFGGNPAAVVITDEPLAQDLMLGIAAENNLAETAFVVPRGSRFSIRWFTPTVEMDLCGHATLASAFALNLSGQASASPILFDSRSGELSVDVQSDRLALNFPARPSSPVSSTQRVAEALGVRPVAVHEAQATLAILESEAQVRALTPRLDLVVKLPGYGLIVTAPGEQCDFVSRFFAPQVGVPEDSVTGSAHCILVPYWSQRLGRKELHARQLSARGGELWCEDRGERVIIAGYCALYLKGEIEV